MPQANGPTGGANGKQESEPLPRLGDFEIIERIGQGAVGAVFKARQLSMDRLVAVKVLKPRLAEDPGYVERFWREARAAARLSHPNIVLAIDAGEAAGYYYFVMEYVEGHPVSLLRKAAVFEEKRALEIARQVAEALDYAWTEERIVHRDIKPGNIIITPDGTAKLADLGLAHDVLAADDADDPDGAVLGTPLYVAPEQIRRAPDLDVRCDLYALGATLFHMVTGRPPYRGSDSKAIIRKHIHQPVPDPREFRPELSDGIAHIITTLLAKDRDERYPDADALIADIDAVLETGRLRGRGAPGHRHPARRRRRATLQSLIALCLALGAIGAVAIALWRLRRREPRTHTPRPATVHTGAQPTSTIVVERPSAARHAYDQAVAFLEARPADYVRAIALLQAVEAAHPASTYAKLAAQRRERLETALDEKAEDTLKALTRQADKLVASGHYAQAPAVLDRFPDGLATQEWRGRVADARKAIEEKARQRFEGALAPGDKAAEDGRLEDALELYKAIPAPPLPAWRDELAERRAGVERRIAKRAERAKAQAEAAYLRLVGQLAALYRARDYAAAAELLAAKLDAMGEERRRELERELAELEELRGFWRAVEAGARKAVGKPYSVRGIPGHIRSVEHGRITIRTAGRPFSEELVNVPGADAVAFALGALAGRQGELAVARFLTAEGQAAAAEERLAKLQAGGADVTALRARLELLCRGELRAALAAELTRARAAAEPGAALRAFLERYQAQAAAADLCDEARRLLDQRATPPEPAAPAAGGALPAQVRLGCVGAFSLFLNGQPVASGEGQAGQLATHALEVRDGDVLACEAASAGPHPGFYAALSVAGGRYVVASDSTWLVTDEPREGWQTDPRPADGWRPARRSYSPHVKPGYGEVGRGLPGYWVWGSGARCCFHKVVRLARTADEQARGEREREAALTGAHGPPVAATVALTCTGAYELSLNGRPVGCSATPVPAAAYELALRQGDVLGIRAAAGERGWLDARIDLEGIEVPILTDRSWVYTAPPAPQGWDRRGAPAGMWRAPAFLDAQSQRIWGTGAVLLLRKTIDLDRLRSPAAGAARRLHGRAEAQGLRTTGVVYDLKDPEQLADWHSGGDLAWSKGRVGGTPLPVVTDLFSAADVQIDVELMPVVDLVVGLWGQQAGRREGYTLSVSDSRRATVILRRRTHTLWMERVTTASGATRRVSLRRYGKLFIVMIDGRRVFSARDKEPLVFAGTQQIGFVTPAHSRGAVKGIRIAGRLDPARLGPRQGPPPPEPDGDPEPD